MLHKSGDYTRGEQRHSVTLSRFRTSDVVSVVSKPGPIILPVMWRPPEHRDIMTLSPGHVTSIMGRRHAANTGDLKRKFGQIPLTIVSFTLVSVGDAGTDTREEFAKTAVNLSILLF